MACIKFGMFVYKVGKHAQQHKYIVPSRDKFFRPSF